MGEKDIDDVSEGLNESDDNLYGPCFTANFGLCDIPIMWKLLNGFSISIKRLSLSLLY